MIIIVASLKCNQTEPIGINGSKCNTLSDGKGPVSLSVHRPVFFMDVQSPQCKCLAVLWMTCQRYRPLTISVWPHDPLSSRFCLYMQSPPPSRYYYSILPLRRYYYINWMVLTYCSHHISIPLHHMIPAILITHYYFPQLMYVKSSASFVRSLHTDEDTRLGQNVCWQQDLAKQCTG